MTNKYQVTFDSGDEIYFKLHIGDIIVKFLDNSYGIYLSKLDDFSREVTEENKRNMVEGF